MKNFSTYLKIIKSEWATLLVYLSIFSGIVVAFTVFHGSKNMPGNFEAVRPEFTIINRDGDDAVATGLLNYLSQYGNEISLKDNPEALQDAVFFRESSAIFIVPDGFTASLNALSQNPAGKLKKIESVIFPGAATGYYMERLCDNYIKTLKLYKTANLATDNGQILKMAQADLSHNSRVIVKQFGGNKAPAESLLIYFRYLPYGLLILLIFSIGSLFSRLEEPYVKMRCLVSPETVLATSFEKLSFAFMYSAGIWLLLTLIGFLMNITKLADIDIRIIGLIMLNGFCFMTFGLLSALIISLFITTNEGLNQISNLLGLFMSFAGGIFVPLEFMGQGILKLANFIPAYWHTRALEKIGELSVFNAESLQTILQPMGMQLCFSLTLLLLYIALKRIKMTEESFGSATTRTQLF